MSATPVQRDAAAELPATSPEDAQLKRLGRYVPLMILVPLAIMLGIGLTLNPREIPSPLIGKPVPVFDLAPVPGREVGLSSADLAGEVSIVNVFASWCLACRQEHPLWMALQRRAVVPIHGLNYKDLPKEAAGWLDELGDPYARTGFDWDGRVGIDWGVYGVPETFVVDRHGRIVLKHVGPITEEALDQAILPMIAKLQIEAITPRSRVSALLETARWWKGADFAPWGSASAMQ